MPGTYDSPQPRLQGAASSEVRIIAKAGGRVNGRVGGIYGFRRVYRCLLVQSDLWIALLSSPLSQRFGGGAGGEVE